MFLLVEFAALWFGVGLVSLLMVLFDPAVGAFFAGAALIGVAWFTWELIEDHSGARNWALGALGEDLTADALEKVKGHEVIHGLKFHGFDVDHVIVGPSGVWAVETKWTERDLDLSRGPNERRVIRDLGDARRGADQITRFLQQTHRVDVVAQPMLIAWGSGVRDVEGGEVELEGVRVLVGRQGRRWRVPVFSGGLLSDEHQVTALRALRFQERRPV